MKTFKHNRPLLEIFKEMGEPYSIPLNTVRNLMIGRVFLFKDLKGSIYYNREFVVDSVENNSNLDDIIVGYHYTDPTLSLHSKYITASLFHFYKDLRSRRRIERMEE